MLSLYTINEANQPVTLSSYQSVLQLRNALTEKRLQNINQILQESQN